jgi:hypothetical protein
MRRQLVKYNIDEFDQGNWGEVGCWNWRGGRQRAKDCVPCLARLNSAQAL